MRTPRQTDPQFKLRLTPEIDEAIEAAAARSGRKKNGEILFRLQQSLMLPEVQFPEDLVRRMEAASPEQRARANKALAEEIVSVLKDYFPPPPPKRKYTPEALYEAGMAMIEQAPEEERQRLVGEVLEYVRKVTRNPNWVPSEDPA